MRAFPIALLLLITPAAAQDWRVLAQGRAADRLDRDALSVSGAPVTRLRFCAGATDARIDSARITLDDKSVLELEPRQRVKRRTCGPAIDLGPPRSIRRVVMTYEAINPTNIATSVRIEGR